MATPEVVSKNAATVLRARDFSKRYRSTVAVDALDLEIRRGEVFGLIGPDGAGKSSLMKAAAGVLSFDAGTLGCALDCTAFGARDELRGIFDGMVSRS